MDAKPLQVSGVVRRRTVARGSKSEREAVVLDTEGGESYVLRRKGGPALGDDQLDHLVGRSIAAEGIGIGQVLIMHDWRTND
jgi:hypothetical protein